MDSQEFDALARGVGAHATRRDAIRWIGAVVLGAVGLAGLIRPAAAKITPGNFGDPCDPVEGSCASPYTCFEGACDLPRGCVGEGQRAVSDFSCCEEDGLVDIDGICTVPVETTLPATGIGIPDDTEQVAGLAIAGAAVLVASKLIRDKERDPEL